MRRIAWVLAAWLVLAALLDAQARPDRMMADELFVAYRARGPRTVSDAIGPMSNRFERFLSDFDTRVLPAWRLGPRSPLQALFMLDVAIATAGDRHRYPGWENFITLGAKFLSDRPESPGANPSADAFEILWHQTAVAFLDGLQNPSLRDLVGIQPMAGRIAASAAPAGSRTVLVTPWVELARGVSIELISIDHPDALEVLGPVSLEHYRLAVSAGGPARVEAALRSARMLIRLQRPIEALGILTAFDDAWTTDVTYRYWHRLLRGQACDALGRLDDAILAYEDALRIVPSAQAPRIAIAVIQSKRQRPLDVATQLDALRDATDMSTDPWSTYGDGDARFFQQRMAELRQASLR